jgi:hypothetical protein
VLTAARRPAGAVPNTADGTINNFDWASTHCAQLFVTNRLDGRQVEVDLTTSAPTVVAHQGFKPSDFGAGDKVFIAGTRFVIILS